MNASGDLLAPDLIFDQARTACQSLQQQQLFGQIDQITQQFNLRAKEALLYTLSKKPDPDAATFRAIIIAALSSALENQADDTH